MIGRMEMKDMKKEQKDYETKNRNGGRKKEH